MSPQERPFNQPVSVSGKAVFALINWMERRVVASSLVGTTPFFEEAYFPWLDGLKSEWEAVREEADVVRAMRDRLPAFQDISEEVGYISKDDQWKTFMLLGYGFRCKRNLEQCPATANALRHIPGVRTAFYSILAPGKKLPPHRGPYNGVLRLHLGLVIPEAAERCWIRVQTERHHWQPGEVLIFDDSLEHEVHNDTDAERVVLFIDFLRPCRWPINWLNRLLVFIARFSPLVKSAKRNHARWERNFYGSDQ